MKHRVKSAEGGNAQQFKFRARVFKMESIIDIDVSNCAYLLANDSFSEWQELLSEELDDKVMISWRSYNRLDCHNPHNKVTFSPLQIRVNEEDEALEQDWNAQESDLDGIVNIHNQLFGSIDLVERVSYQPFLYFCT